MFIGPPIGNRSVSPWAHSSTMEGKLCPSLGRAVSDEHVFSSAHPSAMDFLHPEPTRQRWKKIMPCWAVLLAMSMCVHRLTRWRWIFFALSPLVNNGRKIMPCRAEPSAMEFRPFHRRQEEILGELWAASSAMRQFYKRAHPSCMFTHTSSAHVGWPVSHVTVSRQLAR